MRISQFTLQTLKETPADAEIVSHRLMLRAGMIRKLAAGLYTWLPLGLRVLRKVEAIVRDEMERAGALEVQMPVVQPAELWQESCRWDQFGPELLRFKDRHGRDFCLGPTHEEIITELARAELRSYKQLPVNYYQMQIKFRDETRPRFGVMRAREFLMKDAYSFHINQESLQQTYEKMHEAYNRIFSRCGLNFRPVQADTGSMGGSISHEFHVLADSGEDAIAFSTESDYAANVELALAASSGRSRTAPAEAVQTVDTPDQKTIKEVSEFLKVEPAVCLKTLVVHGTVEGSLIALVLRGDHELNPHKAEKLDDVAMPFTLASDEDIRRVVGCSIGSIGPVKLDLPLYVDHSAVQVADFICGANVDNKHYTGVNWGRDLPEPIAVDLRKVQEGDPSPDGKGRLTIARGIEVGHIFQLGTKYSKAMNATVLDEHGHSQLMVMGTYGIGVSRIVAAAIEQHHDEKGIIWPAPIAPFQVAILPMKYGKSQRVREAIERLYNAMSEAGIEPLLDDRDVRPGFMFADMELIGIPHRVVLSERGLDDGQVEYRGRTENENTMIPIDKIVSFLQEKLVHISH